MQQVRSVRNSLVITVFIKPLLPFQITCSKAIIASNDSTPSTKYFKNTFMIDITIQFVDRRLVLKISPEQASRLSQQ